MFRRFSIQLACVACIEERYIKEVSSDVSFNTPNDALNDALKSGIIAWREMTSLNDTGDGSAADGGGSIGRGSSTMVMMILFFVCDEFVLD